MTGISPRDAHSLDLAHFAADCSGAVQNFAWGAALVAVLGVGAANLLDTATRQPPATAALAMKVAPGATQPQDMSRRVSMLPKPQESTQRRWFWQRDPYPVGTTRQPVKNVLANPSLGMPQH